MPSEKVLEAKKAQVAELVESLKTATTGVLVDYRGLSVEEDTKLRNDLRAAGVKYFVVKNTLLRLAANQVGLEDLDSILHGPTALAISDDPVAPAKVIADFAKDNEKMEIKSGFMDGKVMTLDEIKALAKTPSKETLIAKMMGSLNSPISGLARLLSTIVDGGVEISDLIAKKAGEAAPAEEAAAEAPAEEAPAAEAVAETPAEEAPAAEEAAEAPAAEEAAEASADAE
ncbi:MAG: 50S ribosomal protein L10 [Eubacteriales bacterium]|nr:50S ribosomal protein L10 [Eubacteriales bacterium]